MKDSLLINEKPPFDVLYQTYYPAILRYIRKKINNPEDAEDLAGDVFTYCFKNYEGFDPDRSSVSTWLYLVANSRIKNYYRDFKYNSDIDLLIGSLKDDRIDMDLCIYLEQMRSQLEQALEKLPPRQRTIVTMKYFEERSANEIGLALGMTPINVRVQLSRALAKLRELCSHILEGEK